MDIKKTFEGGEPNISNPDLMLMQYSNRDGITSLCQNLDSKNFGVNLTNVEINATYSHLDALCTCSLSDGFIIVKGEVAQVADDTEITFTANPGPTGITFRIFAYIEDTANPLGTKTFNNGTIRETWIERRIKIGAQAVVGGAVTPGYAIELGRIKFTQNTNNIDITYTAPRSLGEVAAQYNSPNLTELNENRSTTFNRVLTPNNLWSVLGRYSMIKRTATDPTYLQNRSIYSFTLPAGTYTDARVIDARVLLPPVDGNNLYRTAQYAYSFNPSSNLMTVTIDDDLAFLGNISCEVLLMVEK